MSSRMKSELMVFYSSNAGQQKSAAKLIEFVTKRFPNQISLMMLDFDEVTVKLVAGHFGISTTPSVLLSGKCISQGKFPQENELVAAINSAGI